MIKKKNTYTKLIILGILTILLLSVASSFGHTHDDGREKDNCVYDLFINHYTALESEDIRLDVPEDIFEVTLSGEIDFYPCRLFYYNTAFPNAPPA